MCLLFCDVLNNSQQLVDAEQQLHLINADASATRQQVQAAESEAERLRLLMYAEQRHLKEALRQKKEMNAHLRQSLLQLRSENDQKTATTRREMHELREQNRALQQLREREQKELVRAQQREHSTEGSTQLVSTLSLAGPVHHSTSFTP